MPINKGLFTSNNPAYETPKEFYNKYNSKYNFTLDACASDTNHLCDKYYTVNNSCLDKDWTGNTVWMNPPYGNEISKFIKKAYDEWKDHNVETVMLLPARTDTKWFHDYIYRKRGVKIEFIKGRLHFCTNGVPDKNGAPFPSMIVVYKKREDKICQ